MAVGNIFKKPTHLFNDNSKIILSSTYRYFPNKHYKNNITVCLPRE